ncbi:YaiI/YqxD family protein [Azospirillum sp. B4]|uniref:YaiI/YqxD family protein n=1 Tax=Azospirillum sp. B4 TaxID=95605 RepID=UPI0018FF5330|nr:YaiI/YqxD family protein [Azospirillum sp. B4]
MDIYVDADACPVKEEVFKVSERYQLKTYLVSNGPLRVPAGGLVQLVVVSDSFDAADDWIATHCGVGDIVITADIPLADRCLKAGSRVIGPTGRPFTPQSIGTAIATRALMSDLRAMGVVQGGNAPMAKRDKSQFLQALDQAVNAIRKAGK